MNVVVRKLIAKELFVNRWFMVSASVAALASVAIASTGRTGFNIGSLTWITTIIALGVMLAIYGIQNERKEHSLQFVLSLPLSTGDYVRAKQIGLALCYFVPWLISSGAAIAMIMLSAERPHGFLPYLILLCTFLITNFSLVLCGALHVKSEALMSAVVIVTNMAVTLFMFLVGAVDDINAYMWGPVPVWNTAFWTVLAVELLTLVVAFALPFFVAARRRDFI